MHGEDRTRWQPATRIALRMRKETQPVPTGKAGSLIQPCTLQGRARSRTTRGSDVRRALLTDLAQ